jgi:hypothetical protein
MMKATVPTACWYSPAKKHRQNNKDMQRRNTEGPTQAHKITIGEKTCGNQGNLSK